VPGISMDSVSNLSPEFQKAFSAAVQAERRPIQQLENRKTTIESKTNLLNDLNTKVESLKETLPTVGTPFAIRELSFTSDDDKVITGSADKSAADKGKHNLEVLQLAGSASALYNPISDKNETSMGTGYITFSKTNGETEEIFIDQENSNLEGIARVINSAGLGVKATVVNDNSEDELAYRLLIRAEGVGTQNNIGFPELYLAGGEEELYVESQQGASNAVIKYQGFEIQSPTNELKDIIPGATLNLKGTTDPGKPITVTIEQDIPKTTTKMKDVVDKVNQILSFVQSQNKMDANTDTSKTLGGDYGIRLVEDRLRSALQQNFIGDPTRKFRSLGDVGIQFNKQGTLTFDEKKFQSALESNFEDVVALMAGNGESSGIIPTVINAVNSISNAGSGVITNQLQNYNNQLRTIDRNIETKEKQIERKAEALKNQLASAQSALNSMQGQSNYFQSTLNSVKPPNG